MYPVPRETPKRRSGQADEPNGHLEFLTSETSMGSPQEALLKEQKNLNGDVPPYLSLREAMAICLFN